MKQNEILGHALDIICRQFYVITPVTLVVEKQKAGYRVCFVLVGDSSVLSNYYFSADEIEVIWKAVCTSPFTSIHTKDHWREIVNQVQKWEAEK